MKNFLLCFTIMFASCQYFDNQSSKKRTISIQPITPYDKATIQSLQASITQFYNANVIVHPAITLPSYHYTFIKGKRIFADSVLRLLKRNKNDSIDYVLGITAQDICTNKYDAFGCIKSPKAKYQSFGIFGLGYQPGCANIISTCRLQTTNANRHQKRITHVALHELGHNMGLPHCKTLLCLMQDAEEKMTSLDEENIILCKKCKDKIDTY